MKSTKLLCVGLFKIYPKTRERERKKEVEKNTRNIQKKNNVKRVFAFVKPANLQGTGIFSPENPDKKTQF